MMGALEIFCRLEMFSTDRRNTLTLPELVVDQHTFQGVWRVDMRVTYQYTV